MAYMTQDNKKSKAPEVKAVLKKYGLKGGSLSVEHRSTLVLTIRKGELDFISNYNTVGEDRISHYGKPNKAEGYISINPYWYRDHFDGKCRDFLTEVLDIMNNGNHDRSDIMTDYFDVGWYVSVNIGKWDKPYEKLKA